MFKIGTCVLTLKLITGLIIVFFVGCATIPEKEMSSAEQAIDKNKTELKEQAEKVTAISSDVLYLLMAGEIAGQRNQYGVALDAYLQAAKRVDDPRIAERAAKIGLFLKNSEKTDEAVALWLKQDKDNLTARKIAVLSALRGVDKALAVEHLNGILKDDPAGFEPTLIKLIKTLEKEGNAEFIFSVLEDLSGQHQDQAVVFFVQAVLASQLKKQDVAIEKVNRALELQPDWDKALLLRAQFAAQNNEMVLARELLEKVLKKTPENERIRRMLAQVLVKSKAYDDAINLYQNFLKNQPDDGESLFAIALIYLQQEKNEQALDYFKKLVNKPMWDSQASFYIGRLKFKQKSYDEALIWFDKVTKGSYYFDASMAGISVLLNKKDFVEAESRLVDLSEKFPRKELSIFLLKAEMYSEQKKYQKAFDVLSEALKQFPEHRDLLYTRALIAEKLDKLAVLETDLKKILLKNPEDASALNALGYTLVDRTERYDEAAIYLEKAIKLNPDEAVIIDSIGWLYFKKGDMAEAIKHLRNAYQKQPESEIAAHLAEVLWFAGNKDEAKVVFDAAIKKAPDDEYLLEFQQKFLNQNNQ